MNKIIVTTTINQPTEAIDKYASMCDWHLVIAGDLKTPHNSYQKLENVTYLSPEKQEEMYPRLSKLIGWNTIRRRNFAILHAYKIGADIIATVDDDNIPLSNWGKNLLIGKEVEVDYYDSTLDIFDPLFPTQYNYLWHRGFPIQFVKERNVKYLGKRKIRCLVQADLWNGDPDIDAICRIIYKPNVEFKVKEPFSSNKICLLIVKIRFYIDL